MSIFRDVVELFKALIPALILFTTVFCLALVAYWALDHYLKLPVVYESHSTGECIEVEQPAKTAECYDCNNLPPRYHHVWVM